jgi:hypothetical protein
VGELMHIVKTYFGSFVCESVEVHGAYVEAFDFYEIETALVDLYELSETGVNQISFPEHCWPHHENKFSKKRKQSCLFQVERIIGCTVDASLRISRYINYWKNGNGPSTGVARPRK